MIRVAFIILAALLAGSSCGAEEFDYQDPAFWSMIHVFPYRYETLRAVVESDKPEQSAARLRKAFMRRGITPDRVDGNTTYFVIADTLPVIRLLDSFGTVASIVREGKKDDGAELCFKRDSLRREKDLVADTLREAHSVSGLLDVELDSLDALIARHEEAASGVALAVQVRANGQQPNESVVWPSGQKARKVKKVARKLGGGGGLPMAPGGGMLTQPAIANSYWTRLMVQPSCFGAAPEYMNVVYEGEENDEAIVGALRSLGAIDNPPTCPSPFGGTVFWLELDKIAAFQKKAARTGHLAGWQRMPTPGVSEATAHNAEKQKLLSDDLARFAEGLARAPHIVAFVKAEINRLGGGGPGEIATRGRMPVAVNWRRPS